MMDKKIELFPHNQTAYESALRLMEEEGKAAVIHPTGTGKSFIAFKLAEEHPDDQIVWLSPSEHIFRTQLENLHRSLEGKRGHVEGVCRDESGGESPCHESPGKGLTAGGSATGKLPAEGLETQRLETEGLAAEGLEVEGLVPGELPAEAGIPRAENITFLTYSRLMAEGGLREGLVPGYIVLDEFHRCGARQWGKSVEQLLQTFPHAKVLGLSATNIRYLDCQRDMAQELFEGRIASEMTLGEAVVAGILPAPKYIASMYSFREELRKLRRRVNALQNPVLQKKTEELWEKLRRALEQADGPEQIFARHMPQRDGRYIVFCADREHMEEMTGLAGKWFRQVDPGPHIYTAYYNNPGTGREFRKFREDNSPHLKLLFCIDMLNEGVHVEGVAGVILLRPTASPILYLQQIGRALSAGGGKQPVIFDLVNNFDSLCCVDCLRREMDEALIPCTNGERQRFLGQFRIIDEVRECRSLFRQLQENLSASWDIYYRAAEEYHRVHGNLRIPKSYVTGEGLTLGSWLKTQRRLYADRACRLEAMEAEAMEAEATQSEAMETETFEARAEENGHLEVRKPEAGQSESNGMGTGQPETREKWTGQPGVRKPETGSTGSLDADRIEKLNRLGMVWDAHLAGWEQGCKALAAYREQHGDADVPARYRTEDGYLLGRWVTNARQKRVNGSLTGEQTARLDALGMVWDKADGRWNEYYRAAEAYYRKNGSLDMPCGYQTEGGLGLGVWLSTQRKKHKEKSGLSDEQEKLLSAIGMEWEISHDRTWKRAYSLAEEFYRQHGHLDVPAGYEAEGVKLGKWISRIRLKRAKPGSSGMALTGERIEALDRIGMVWEKRRRDGELNTDCHAC